MSGKENSSQEAQEIFFKVGNGDQRLLDHYSGFKIWRNYSPAKVYYIKMKFCQIAFISLYCITWMVWPHLRWFILLLYKRSADLFLSFFYPLFLSMTKSIWQFPIHVSLFQSICDISSLLYLPQVNCSNKCKIRSQLYHPKLLLARTNEAWDLSHF